MKIAVICGGPSLERGISLNSARSVLDHLGGEGVEIVPIYFDHKKRPYAISPDQLYSNTPSDFDFKLQHTAKKLSQTGLKNLLKSVDIAFPAMHGAFGEDGQIQALLERWKVPYVGSPVEACKRCFDKHEANAFIREHGFFTLPSTVLKIHHSAQEQEEVLRTFFKTHQVTRAVIKPATGGSSIGVFSVQSVEEALEKARFLFGKRLDTRLVVEPFCEGIEFTVIVLQNRFHMPVAILPTEIETDYTENQIFDYRKKYLPTRQVRYHCPPRFSNETIEKIQVQAEQLFTALGMQDFARFDGWVLPSGELWFSDFNPISGMEQNSFLFQQTARVGFSHRDILRWIVKLSAERQGVDTTDLELRRRALHEGKKPVSVLFGGQTSERQVSLMSGTNAWLKLRRSHRYDPTPYLLDLNGDVWELPYALTLNHTVEEVLDNCQSAAQGEERLKFLEEKVRLRLAVADAELSAPFFLPRKMSLVALIKEASFVLIGLHGGIGENGTLQAQLTRAGVRFNGSGEEASRLCMDKVDTGKRLEGLEAEGIFVAKKKAVFLSELSKISPHAMGAYFKELQRELQSKLLIIKPRDEGCSSGVLCLKSAEEFAEYVRLAEAHAPFIPKGTFEGQRDIIELPLQKMENLMIEAFIQTDSVRVKGNALKWTRRKGWVEVTVGVLEQAGKVHALSPSLTVSEGEVLSVEEKFQGGTGVNMTPPPEEFVDKATLEGVKQRIEIVAQRLGIEGYARIDTFMHIDTGEILVIEANTMPALTPSTVLFHQALAEEVPLHPLQLLESLIENKGY